MEKQVQSDQRQQYTPSNLHYEFMEIPLNKIVIDREQPRKNFSHIDKLAAVIEKYGQKMPVAVRPIGNGNYLLLDGERRFRALKQLAEEKGEDLESIKIKAMCTQNAEDDTGFIINLIRENYSPLEVALALNKFKKKYGNDISHSTIGKYIGKSRQNVGEYLSLLNLPKDIQDKALEDNCVPFNKLKQLAVRKDMTPDQIAGEYEKLRSQYAEYSAPIPESNIEKQSDTQTEEKNRAETARKKLDAITKKIDMTAKALIKFNVDKIRDEEDRIKLNMQLDMIIEKAKYLKGKLGEIEK